MGKVGGREQGTERILYRRVWALAGQRASASRGRINREPKTRQTKAEYKHLFNKVHEQPPI